MAMPPMYRLDFSKVRRWRQCRLQFWHQYVSGEDRPREQMSAPGIIGKAVHEGMRRLAETGNEDDGRHALTTYLSEEGHESAGPGTDNFSKALELYANGVTAHVSIPAEDSWLELASWAPHAEAGIILHSRLDRVDKLPDGYQAIDWKTGRYEQAEDLDLQLDIAHVILRRTKQAIPKDAAVRTIAWNLATGRKKVRELTLGDRDASVAYLGRLATRMQAETEFEATPGPHCRFCLWRPTCEPAAAAEGDLPERYGDPNAIEDEEE